MRLKTAILRHGPNGLFWIIIPGGGNADDVRVRASLALLFIKTVTPFYFVMRFRRSLTADLCTTQFMIFSLM